MGLFVHTLKLFHKTTLSLWFLPRLPFIQNSWVQFKISISVPTKNSIMKKKLFHSFYFKHFQNYWTNQLKRGSFPDHEENLGTFGHLCWTRQFWINEISKVCYEETLKNGNKHVRYVPGNSCSNIFVNFQFWIANYQLGGL